MDEVGFSCELVKETAKALLVIIDGEEYWIPKSQTIDYDEDYIVMTEWIAKQKGLV